MEELQKDVKYFTRLWQQELSRREKAEAALADLVAAAEPFRLFNEGMNDACSATMCCEVNSKTLGRININEFEIVGLALAVERAKELCK